MAAFPIIIKHFFNQFSDIFQQIFTSCLQEQIQFMGIIGCTTAQPEEKKTNTQSKLTTSSRMAASTLKERSIINKHPESQNVVSSLLNHIANKLKMHSVNSASILFRASQHKFKAEAFHQNCHQKKNTIFIAQTTENNYFGAFTVCQWKKDEVLTYEQDQKAVTFLFRVGDKDIQLYDLKQESRKYAIMNDRDCGPVFGEGHDINIVDDSDKNQSWNNLGRSYNCEFRFGSVKANSELAKTQKFKLKDYQMWEVKLE